MTTNLTTEQIEAGFAHYMYDYHNIVIEYGKKWFQEWLAERDAIIEAAAEQRGAIAAQLCLADDSMEHHEQTDDFPCTRCLEKSGRAIQNSANQMEGDGGRN